MRDVGKLDDFVRTAGRIAACDHNLYRWVVAHEPPDRLPNALICGGGHGACIDHDKLSVLRRRLDGAARLQITSDANESA